MAGPAIYSMSRTSRDFASSICYSHRRLHPTLSQPILLHFWAESLASPGSPAPAGETREGQSTRCQALNRLLSEMDNR